MNKQNTTQNLSFLVSIEKIIRSIPIMYIIFRSIVRFTNYFENDFFYLKKIFKNQKINIIDVGASDGISTLFFLRNLNPKKIYCYEPQKIFFQKLIASFVQLAKSESHFHPKKKEFVVFQGRSSWFDVQKNTPAMGIEFHTHSRRHYKIRNIEL